MAAFLEEDFSTQLRVAGTRVEPVLKVTGYSCARRAKCIGKCILKFANQESRVRRA